MQWGCGPKHFTRDLRALPESISKGIFASVKHSGSQGQPIRIDSPNWSASDFLQPRGPPIRRFADSIRRFIDLSVRRFNRRIVIVRFAGSPIRPVADSPIHVSADSPCRGIAGSPIPRFTDSPAASPIRRFTDCSNTHTHMFIFVQVFQTFTLASLSLWVGSLRRFCGT